MKEQQELVMQVSGIHCAGCVNSIKQTLENTYHDARVLVSIEKAEVTVQVKEARSIDISQINDLFTNSGYTFYIKGEKKLIRIKEGKLIINKSLLNSFLAKLAIITFVSIGFFVLTNTNLGFKMAVTPQSNLIFYFLLGLIAGVSSCLALTGGVLLSLTQKWHETEEKNMGFFYGLKPHIFFHLSRLVSFFVLGILLASLGSSAAYTSLEFAAILVVIISTIMLVLALEMLGLKPATKKFLNLNMLDKYTKQVLRLQTKNNSALLFGFLTFLVPCGFTLSAQLAVINSGSVISGGLNMLAFAFGTLPALLAISLTGLTLTSKPVLASYFKFATGFILVLLSLYNINAQLNILGFYSINDLIQTAQIGSTGFVELDRQGVQKLELIAKEIDYFANGPVKLRAGVPAKLYVDNQGVDGCASFMAARGLISGTVTLQPGVNVVDLGLPKTGTYKITCSMGMVVPLVIQVI